MPLRPLRSSVQKNNPSIQNPRICRFCQRTFHKAEHLTRHERGHTKERPFRCVDCGKCYGRNDSLLRHRRLHGMVMQTAANPSNLGNVLTSSELDEAAKTLVNQQSLPDRQNYSQIAYAEDIHSTGPQDDRDNAIEMNAQIDQRLQSGEPQSMENGVVMDFPSHTLLDAEIQQYSQNGQPSRFSFPPHIEYWNMENELFPSWYIGDDFDIEAFNMSLRSPLAMDQQAYHGPASESNVGDMTALGMEPNSRLMDEIQVLWVTKTDSSWKNDGNSSYSVAPTRPITPTTESSLSNQVDERYRDDLLLKMRPRWKEDPLPSTEFLNLALQLFFTKFNPIFPILHGPTFRPSNHNSLLLLSICSIGSLFMGSKGAAAQGSKIFERLNKVVLASWENILTRDIPERVSLVQAALIGQTFAYLSGNPKYLATVEAFHGTVIAFARRCSLFSATQNIPKLGNETQQQLENTWNAWARAEEMTRTALALYIHDSQFASTFQHDPCLRHNSVRLPMAAAQDIFAASSSVQWATLVRSSAFEPTRLSSHLHLNQHEHSCKAPLAKELACQYSRFSCYVILNGIGAAIQEYNVAGRSNPANARKYQDALVCWYHAYEENRPSQEPDSFCQMILYHEIFMSLLVDFNELERAIGRDGSSEVDAAMNYVNNWSSSVEAKRCVLHASSIYRQVGSMRVDSEPALHVPRSMFLAGIAWYCYIHFDQTDPALPHSSEEFLEIPEIKLLNISSVQHLLDSAGSNKGKPKLIEASPLSGLMDMLYRIGHWGISRRFARILGLLIHGITDSHVMDT